MTGLSHSFRCFCCVLHKTLFIITVAVSTYVSLKPPLSPKIYIQILQTNLLHTAISQENLIKDQRISSLAIILSIVTTLSLDFVFVVLENMDVGHSCAHLVQWDPLAIKMTWC